MPTCPKCGREVSILHAYAREESHYTVYLDETGFKGSVLDYDYQECVEGSATYIDFQCEHCKETLFSSEGETQPQEIIEFLTNRAFI